METQYGRLCHNMVNYVHNKNLATKLKLIEQNFEAKLELIKVDINNRFSCLKTNLSPQKNQKPNFSKCKETYKVKTLSDKFDDLNKRMRICENAVDNEIRAKSQPLKQKIASTPSLNTENLPWGLPPDFSKSVLSPENSCLKPRRIFSPEKKQTETESSPSLNERKDLEDDDGLEDISKDDISEELCILDPEDEPQSFLGAGQKNLLKF